MSERLTSPLPWIEATEFSGGLSRGVCVQLECREPLQLTPAEAAALGAWLLEWAVRQLEEGNNRGGSLADLSRGSKGRGGPR